MTFGKKCYEHSLPKTAGISGSSCYEEDNNSMNEEGIVPGINSRQHRYPYCIVWTPIPVLTWLFPVIGHMGICTSAGVIRDFAGPYHVSEDKMAFGNPTRYVKLDPGLVQGVDWDTGVAEAAGLYKTRMHNLCCDNCHSMVANALNRMKYKGSSSWNMFKVAVIIVFSGKFVGISGALKSLLPSLILYALIGFFFSYTLKAFERVTHLPLNQVDL